MESYINKDTIIENDIYKLFQSSVTCPLCQNIYIKPIMCIKCQKVYCKRCIDNLNQNEKKCQSKCESPEFKNCIAKNDILTKLKFVCVGCNEEIGYDEAEKHHNSCCPDKTSADMVDKNEGLTNMKLKRLTSEEIEEFRKNGEEVI